MSTLTPGRIRHTVSFTLVHEPGSEQERDFLAAQAALGAIPGVEAYELLREVSPKNDFRYGCSMEFARRTTSTPTTWRSSTTGGRPR